MSKGILSASRALAAFTAMASAASAAAAAQTCESTGQPKIFGTLQAARATGVGGPIACSPDGAWAWVRESGAIARIDTSSESNFESAEPVRVSSQWVVPSQLELDPMADAPYGAWEESENEADLLHIAAGRDGYWIMEADVQGSAPKARRVDDAIGSNPSIQTSRRWCCDVDFADVGSTPYVVVLFSAKDDNRLRFYPLDTVRDLMGQSGETGNEIAASLEVTIGRHPSLPANGTDDESSFSFGLAFTVDDVAGDNVMIYLAMGQHGLARVQIQPSHFSGGTPTLQWGPVFGTNSPWFAAHDDPPIFDDIEYKPSPTSGEARHHPPHFMDVVVDVTSTGRFLYTAVDHLGWLRYKVGGGLTPFWSATTVIDHHEGEALDLSATFGDWVVRVLDGEDAGDDPETTFTYPWRLELVEDPVEERTLLLRASGFRVGESHGR